MMWNERKQKTPKIFNGTWSSGCLIKAVFLHNLHKLSQHHPADQTRAAALWFSKSASTVGFWQTQGTFWERSSGKTCFCFPLPFFRLHFLYLQHTHEKWLLDQGYFEKHQSSALLKAEVTGKGNELQGIFSTEISFSSPQGTAPLIPTGKKEKTPKRHLQRDFQLDEKQAVKQDRAVLKAPAWQSRDAAWPQVMWPSADSLSGTDKAEDTDRRCSGRAQLQNLGRWGGFHHLPGCRNLSKCLVLRVGGI